MSVGGTVWIVLGPFDTSPKRVPSSFGAQGLGARICRFGDVAGAMRSSYSEASESWSTRLVGALFGERPFEEVVKRLRGRRAVADGPIGPIALRDVLDASLSFRSQARFLAEHGQDYPCIEAEPNPIPIDLAWNSPFTELDEVDAYILTDVGGWTEQTHTRVNRVSVGRATEYFRAGLHNFVRSRADAASYTDHVPRGESREDRSRDAQETPIFPFEVHTQTSHLQAYSSPAYFFRPRVFGSVLSTPVPGSLDPGLYIFGACRPGDAPQFADLAMYEIPDATAAHLEY